MNGIGQLLASGPFHHIAPKFPLSTTILLHKTRPFLKNVAKFSTLADSLQFPESIKSFPVTLRLSNHDQLNITKFVGAGSEVCFDG